MFMGEFTASRDSEGVEAKHISEIESKMLMIVC